MMGKEIRRALTGKLGYLDEHDDFIESRDFKKAQDGSIREIVIQFYDFGMLRNGRIIDPYGDDIDFDMFLAGAKLINDTGGPICGPNGEIIADVGEELRFRLKKDEHEFYIHKDGYLYIIIDLTVPCKKSNSTYDGYTGAVYFDFDKGTFLLTYSHYDNTDIPSKVSKEDELHNAYACMLSILDTLKLHDTNVLFEDDETLSEMMFRMMEGYGIDLNAALKFNHLAPIKKIKNKDD
jgi:hypothetical protein